MSNAIGPFEDYPVYRLDLIPYGVLEEYVYENRDYYGDDPDWAEVREDLVSMVMDSLRSLTLEIDDMNRRLVFHTIRMEERPSADSVLVWVAVKDDNTSYDDYLPGIVMEMAEILAGNAYYHYDGNDNCSQRHAVSMLMNERTEILYWMDHRLTREGFRIASYPSVNSCGSFRAMDFGRRPRR